MESFGTDAEEERHPPIEAAAISWCRTHFGHERCQCDRVAGLSGAAHGGAHELGGTGGHGGSRGTFRGRRATGDGREPLSMVGQMGLPTALVAPTMAGTT